MSELKQQDLQSVLAWSAEDAIANFGTSKDFIETEADSGDGTLSDGDKRTLKYLLDVYRYCVNVATTKQVLIFS